MALAVFFENVSEYDATLPALTMSCMQRIINTSAPDGFMNTRVRSSSNYRGFNQIYDATLPALAYTDEIRINTTIVGASEGQPFSGYAPMFYLD